MKMLPKDYAELDLRITNALVGNAVDVHKEAKHYQDQGLSDMRFRWDLLHFAGVRIGQRSAPGTHNFYDYLDDNHIDTALKSIVKGLLS